MEIRNQPLVWIIQTISKGTNYCRTCNFWTFSVTIANLSTTTKKDLLFIKYAHGDILFHIIDSNSMILAFTAYTDLLQTAAFHTQPMVKTIFESDKKSINSF